MRNMRKLVLAAFVAASALVGATAQPAAAAVTAAEALVAVPDGRYPVYDENGTLIGWITIRGGVVVDGEPAVN